MSILATYQPKVTMTIGSPRTWSFAANSRREVQSGNSLKDRLLMRIAPAACSARAGGRGPSSALRADVFVAIFVVVVAVAMDDLRKIAGPTCTRSANDRSEWKSLEEAFVGKQVAPH
ncbi:hypothetical protein EVAR_25267_1 [Eumeta japonica]|uniref:Uncharacterized protein n=1 Tax=Eumeta variegata TaxID=151549 RepID=A0A4C1VRH6_EUMVA|nr:hypothetical protein EVAR_25267_1 [Eumeta japonica]